MTHAPTTPETPNQTAPIIFSNIPMIAVAIFGVIKMRVSVSLSKEIDANWPVAKRPPANTMPGKSQDMSRYSGATNHLKIKPCKAEAKRVAMPVRINVIMVSRQLMV